MAINHPTTKAPGEEVHAVADWNAAHIADTALVTNLNADFLDNHHASDFITFTGASRIRAYRNTTNQSIGAGAWTKIQLNAESYDNLGEYDPVTNFRFTPAKAGYYLITGQIMWAVPGDMDVVYTSIYMNGVEIARGTLIVARNYSDVSVNVSTIVYLDPDAAPANYIELYGFSSSACNAYLGSAWTYLCIHKLS